MVLEYKITLKESMTLNYTELSEPSFHFVVGGEETSQNHEWDTANVLWIIKWS